MENQKRGQEQRSEKEMVKEHGIKAFSKVTDTSDRNREDTHIFSTMGQGVIWRPVAHSAQV